MERPVKNTSNLNPKKCIKEGCPAKRRKGLLCNGHYNAARIRHSEVERIISLGKRPVTYGKMRVSDLDTLFSLSVYRKGSVDGFLDEMVKDLSD